MVVNLKVLIILIVLNLIFLIGCAFNNTSIQGKVIEKIKKDVETFNQTIIEKQIVKEEIKKDIINHSVENKPKEQEEKFYYDIKKLEDDINEVMGSSYNFTDDLSKPQYVKSSHLKYYVIDKTDNKQNFINNVKDFCDKY